MTLQRTISPVDGRVYVERTLATPVQVDAALESARLAQRAWRAVPMAERAAILDAAWCTEETRAAVEEKVVVPLLRLQAKADAKRRAETAATKVDFFTMVRGED